MTTVSFDSRPATSESAPATTGPSSSPLTPPPRLLLVDDHELNLTTLEDVLGADHYEMHIARDGHAACDAALRLRPDLILLDVMMPSMDGYDVCRFVRAQPSIQSVPVVMVTALNDRESRIKGLQAGADDFISKPFSLEELRARVRTITRLNRARVIGEQRARFERLFAITPSAILVVGPDGIVQSVNERARELLGWSPAAPDDRRALAELLPPDAATRIAERVGALFGRPAPEPTSAHLRISSPAGPRIWNLSVVRLDDRAALALVSLDDITAEVTAKENAESLNERLESLVRERTERLATANKLLMSYALFVTHDLRSPLTAVKGYLSLAGTLPGPIPVTAATCISKAAAAALIMEEMITETLALAAEKNSGQQPARLVDPTPSIRRVASKLLSLAKDPKPELVVHPLPPLLTTLPLIDRVFFNLIANAIKYSASRPNPKIEVGAADTPQGPALYVRDNGVGFSNQEGAELFKEFSRLSTAEGHDGLGLGLSLVARLVHSHHGRIWAEGRVGEGATFYVWFPSSLA